MIMQSCRPLLCALLAFALGAGAPPAASGAKVPCPALVPFEAKSGRSLAGPTLRLTLSKAIQLAIEKNLALKVEAFNPRIADTRVLTEKGAFDPELRAGFEHDMTRNTENSELHTGNFSAGFGGTTALGSTYSFGLTNVATEYNKFQAGAAISLTQPLLRGFGTAANLANLHIALNDRRNTEWAFRQQVIDVVTRTVSVYNALYSAQRDYEAAIRSRDAALQLQHDEERRMEIGVKTALDVTTARSAAASREEAVLVTREAIEENERYLKQIVTDSTETLLDTRVQIEPPPLPSLGQLDIKAGLREAFQLRPDYREALITLQTRHINVVLTRNQALPRVDLTGSLNLLGVNSTDAAGSFGYLSDANGEPNTWSAGLVFRLPLPNRSARGKLAGAKLQDAQALVDLHRLEQNIIVEVANAAGQIVTARKRIDATTEALRLAKESLSAGEQRLKAGAATTFEVLQLQQQLTEAEASEIKAEGDYRNAIADYDSKTGATLERNAITLAP